ncbi:MAG: hypothetical protein IT494_05190 [Gammaproteobacteria bacterium]|nr:hypothetical protein [Gammaproteobacteria bacterium]
MKAEQIVDTGAAAAALAARRQRVLDAVALRSPDRTPFSLQLSGWAAHQDGLDFRATMYDPVKVGAAVRRLTLELQPDLFQAPFMPAFYGPSLEALDIQGLRWPGHGVPDDSPYQYLDQEFMRADEYDDYLLDPTGFHLNVYLPRIASALAGLARFPLLPALASTQIIAGTLAFTEPEFRAVLDRLTLVGEQLRRNIEQLRDFAMEMAALGFPSFSGGFASAPFDHIADYMRGAKGALLDMRRQPDKLLAAIEKVKVFTIRHTLRAAAGRPGSHVFMPLHWGLGGFMSEEQFCRFYWPSLREVIIALIDGGLVPAVFWEGDCTSRLELIADIPRGKAIYKFERTDLFRAKEVLGDVVCLQGNVPVTLLSAGTPEDIDAYARRLLEQVGKGGGFILDSSAGLPPNTPRANVEAMVRAVHRYHA